MRGTLLSAGLALAAAAAEVGLYALDANAALVRRPAGGGAWVSVGAPLPYVQAQQLSCIDSARELFYMVGYSRSTSGPFLVGIALADGVVQSATPLPFFDQTYIGIGQYVAVEPKSARVFVGGQDSSRNHIVGLVDPASGSFEVLANLTSSLRDVFGGTSAFIPATNELWFELDLDIIILNIETRKVDVLPVSSSFSILGMNFDATRGVIVGLDGGPGQGVRTIVELNPRTRTLNETGTVPAYAMQMGGMTAYNAAARTVFWIAQKTGAGSDAPWWLVQNNVVGGAVVTAEPICVPGGVCPWSLHYFDGVPVPSVQAAPSAVPAGEPFTVWAAVDTLHKCGFIDVPDIPARAFIGTDLQPHMIVGSTAYHRMSGPTIINMTRECAYAWNSSQDSDPSHFAGDEFLDSPVLSPTTPGVLYALIHTEFPGNVYHNCTGPAYPHCWTVSIGLAVSHDDGATWAHARTPPDHLVAAVPYAYNESQLAYGWGDPSNILKASDGYYYAAIWNRNVVGLQAPGVCMMRTGDVSDPASWRGWGGESYNVSFVSPYTLTPGTEAEHVCVVTNLPSCPLGGLVWSTTLHLYVGTMDCSLQGGSHFYWVTSADLITWSTPVTLYTRENLPPPVSRNVTSMSYPVFMDVLDTTHGNFDTIGAHPYLFWVSIGHSPYTDGRRLWATPFTISV